MLTGNKWFGVLQLKQMLDSIFKAKGTIAKNLFVKACMGTGTLI